MATKAWPKVLVDDDGIRPAGLPDQCFYCQQKVGEPHGAKCVMVVARIQYRVYAKIDGMEKQVGFFARDDPYFWDWTHCEFHKNDSSWCADNALDSIVWSNDAFSQKAKQVLEGLPGSQCSCNALRFEFHATVDEGPNRADGREG